MTSPFNIHSGFQKSRKSSPEIKMNHSCQVIEPNPAFTISNIQHLLQVIFSTALTRIWNVIAGFDQIATFIAT